MRRGHAFCVQRPLTLSPRRRRARHHLTDGLRLSDRDGHEAIRYRVNSERSVVVQAPARRPPRWCSERARVRFVAVGDGGDARRQPKHSDGYEAVHGRVVAELSRLVVARAQDRRRRRRASRRRSSAEYALRSAPRRGTSTRTRGPMRTGGEGARAQRSAHSPPDPAAARRIRSPSRRRRPPGRGHSGRRPGPSRDSPSPGVRPARGHGPRVGYAPEDATTRRPTHARAILEILADRRATHTGRNNPPIRPCGLGHSDRTTDDGVPRPDPRTPSCELNPCRRRPSRSRPRRMRCCTRRSYSDWTGCRRMHRRRRHRPPRTERRPDRWPRRSD